LIPILIKVRVSPKRRKSITEIAHFLIYIVFHTSPFFSLLRRSSRYLRRQKAKQLG
jgi:hypothetical protein